MFSIANILPMDTKFTGVINHWVHPPSRPLVGVLSSQHEILSPTRLKKPGMSLKTPSVYVLPTIDFYDFIFEDASLTAIVGKWGSIVGF